MEMHAAVADYDHGRDRMTVHASTQVPYYVHLMLSQILGMDMSRIRVVKRMSAVASAAALRRSTSS